MSTESYLGAGHTPVGAEINIDGIVDEDCDGEEYFNDGGYNPEYGSSVDVVLSAPKNAQYKFYNKVNEECRDIIDGLKLQLATIKTKEETCNVQFGILQYQFRDMHSSDKQLKERILFVRRKLKTIQQEKVDIQDRLQAAIAIYPTVSEKAAELVTKMELIKCVPIEAPKHESSRFYLFKMQKVYTINCQKYVDEGVMRVLKHEASYADYLKEFPDKPCTFYENLTEAKEAFLNAPRMEQKHKHEGAQEIYNDAARYVAPQEQVAEHVLCQSLGYSKYPNGDDIRDFRIYKLLQLNGISYFLSTDTYVHVHEGSMMALKSKIDAFIQKPLTASEIHQLVSMNTKEFDTVTILIDRQLDKQIQERAEDIKAFDNTV